MRASRRRKAAVQPRFNQRELHTAYARRICAEEAERSRIARDLHDNIGQRLAVLTMKLDTLADSLSSAEPELRKRLQDVSSDAIDLAKDVHAISRTLDSSGIEHLGLAAAASGFCRTVSEQQKISIQFSADNLRRSATRYWTVCLSRAAGSGQERGHAQPRASNPGHAAVHGRRDSARRRRHRHRLRSERAGRALRSRSHHHESASGTRRRTTLHRIEGGRRDDGARQSAASPVGRPGRASRDQAPRPHSYSYASAQCLASPCGFRASWA